MDSIPSAFCSLDDIIVEPAEDAMAPGDQATEKAAFLDLSQALAQEPALACQRLVELAMKLTGAESAGLSLEEQDQAGAFYRWVATCGEFARYLHGTMPRDFSPCGAAVDYRQALVMRDPVRYYAYISQLHAPVSHVMLVPFARGGRLVGTVWVVSHTAGRSFSASHLRLVQGLATFASAVLDAQRQAQAGG